SSDFRADTLLLRSCAAGLRALGLSNIAQLLHNSPFGRGLASLRALAKSLPGSGLMLQTLRSAASARLKASRRFEAARPASDWRPIPSLRSVIPRPPVGRAARLTQHRIRRVWGRSLLLSLVGTRSCFCRDRISQRWGASFSLLSLGASHHGPPAFGGLRKLSLMGSEEFLPLPSVDKQSAFSLDFGQRTNKLSNKDGLRGARPLKPHLPSKHRSIAIQTSFNRRPNPE